MRDNFSKAKRILRTSSSKETKNIIAINGCCYGRDNQPDKGEYFKYCGQTFLGLVSGDKDLYLDIIEHLGHKAREKNEIFLKSYSKIINKFTSEFSEEYCKTDSSIDWEKIAKLNSSEKLAKEKKVAKEQRKAEILEKI